VIISGTLNATGVLPAPRIDATINLTGTINVNPSSTLVLNGSGTNRISGGQINGPGDLELTSGIVLVGFGSINADELVLNGDSQLLADNGVLTISSDVQGTGTVGTQSPTGSLNFPSASSIVSGAAMNISGGVVTSPALTNSGLVVGHGTINADHFYNSGGTVSASGGPLEIINVFSSGTSGGLVDGVFNAIDGDIRLSTSVADSSGQGIELAEVNIGPGREFSFETTGQSDVPLKNVGQFNLVGGRLSTTSSFQNLAGSALHVSGATSTIESNIQFEAASTTTLETVLRIDGLATVRSGATLQGSGTLLVTEGSVLTVDDGVVDVPIQSNGTVRVLNGTATFNQAVTNGPTTLVGPPQLFLDQADWLTKVTSLEANPFRFSAANVALADQVTTDPAKGAPLGSTLTFRGDSTGLSRSFQLSTLEQGASFAAIKETGAFPPALSVGQFDLHEDDDFRIDLTAGPPLTALALEIFGLPQATLDNLKVFGTDGILLADATKVTIPSAGQLFIGIISDTPITAIEFDEESGVNDIAIFDLRLGNARSRRVVAADRATINFNAGLDNHRTLDLDDTIVNGEVHNFPGASILTQGNVTFNGSVTAPVGSFIEAPGLLTFNNDLTAAANITGGGVVIVNDRYTLGDSTAAVTIDADLQLGSQSSLGIGIAETTPGDGYDQVNVVDTVTLDGTLELQLISGFKPNIGDAFVIVTANTRIGEFDQINGILPEGQDFALAPIYDYQDNIGLTLMTALPGDANLDGNVTLDDLLVLLNNAGTQNDWIGGDFTGDRNVALDDLLILLNNAGTSVLPSMLTVVNASPFSTSVPEPGTLTLLVLGILLYRRKRLGRWIQL